MEISWQNKHDNKYTIYNFLMSHMHNSCWVVWKVIFAKHYCNITIHIICYCSTDNIGYLHNLDARGFYAINKNMQLSVLHISNSLT